MKAMVLERVGLPLAAREIPIPDPRQHQVLLRVKACGVCRTDLHIVDGELTDAKLPLVLGHEIVGVVDQIGEAVTGIGVGDRVGVPWLGGTCRHCSFCLTDRENLCDEAEFTGYNIDGGYAEYAVADHRYCFSIPERYTNENAAPLLCAGLIGYRSYKMTGDAEHLGLYGFGAAAHIIAQLAVHEGRRVYAFTRPGDVTGRQFAMSLGATWAGDSTSRPPEPLDAAIIFAPVGSLVPAALQAVVKGGVVVCAGIHMSDIPAFPYEMLWGERVLRSVANLTRQDGVEFMNAVSNAPIHTEVTTFSLEDANEALGQLKRGELQGAGVLVTESN